MLSKLYIYIILGLLAAIITARDLDTRVQDCASRDAESGDVLGDGDASDGTLDGAPDGAAHDPDGAPDGPGSDSDDYKW
jgi:hypothetical protein